MSTSRDFFRDLPALESFSDSVNVFKHTELPEDWWVVVADVMNSTNAIASGRYKEVNTVGASTIIAVVNVDRAIPIPYVFGGDGVSCAVPPDMELGTRRALLAAQDLARDAFKLELRVGMVPVRVLRAAGEWVRVAKINGPGGVHQMLLSGRGWEAAERWLKSPTDILKMAVRDREGLTAEGSFEGLECRWQAVKSPSGMKLSIVVVSMEREPEAQMKTYTQMLDTIHRIYGDEENFHPLKAESLNLTFSLASLKREVSVRTAGRGPFGVFLYTLGLLLRVTVGTLLFKLRINTPAVKWSRYRNEVVKNSDYRKFDGALKMVIESTAAQRTDLEAYLEKEYQSGRIVYGTHASRAAILTCLVFSYSGNHSHFVDGSDGGYAVAAKGLKERLKQRLAQAR